MQKLDPNKIYTNYDLLAALDDFHTYLKDKIKDGKLLVERCVSSNYHGIIKVQYLEGSLDAYENAALQLEFIINKYEFPYQDLTPEELDKVLACSPK
jgi:hypothetical protein